MEEKRLDLLILTVESFITQLREEQPETNGRWEFYDGIEFKRQTGALADALSHECTKFAMIFTDEAAPSETTVDGLCNRLIGIAAALYKMSQEFPIDQGRHYQRMLRDAVVDVFRSVCSLASAAKQGSSNVKAQLKETGTAWESCDRLKALPKDSRELLSRNITETLNMVNDAYMEIAELSESVSAEQTSEISDDDEPSSCPSLDDQGKLELDACKHLIKAAKAALNKTNEGIGKITVPSPAADNSMISCVVRVSPLIDNIVSSFYATDGSSSETRNNEVVELCDVVKSFLLNFKNAQYFQDDDTKWMNILFTGVEHNLAKYHRKELTSKT